MTQWILTSSVLILLVLAVRGLFKERMKAKYTYALWLIVAVRLLCPVNFGEVSFNLLSLADKGQERLEDRFEERLAAQTEAEAGKTEFHTSIDPDNSAVIMDASIIMDISGNPQGNAVYYRRTQDGMEAVGTREWAAQAGTKAWPDVEAFAKEIPMEAISKEAGETSGFVATVRETAPLLAELDWQKALPALWLAGMLVMAMVIFSVNISFSTMLGMFRKELPWFAKKGRGKKELSVYLADGINSSCLFGVIHPSIYLNKRGMGEREKKYCVEHEYSHYLQGDMVWSLCRTLCLIMHWYNPLVWVAVVLSKKDAELACDERTIERLGEEERYSYGHTRVEIAAGQSKAVQVFGMATLMTPDKKEVVDRVKAITKKKETKILTGLLVTVLLIGISFFVFTGEAKGEQENNNNAVTEAPEDGAKSITSQAEDEMKELEVPLEGKEAKAQSAQRKNDAIESQTTAEGSQAGQETVVAEIQKTAENQLVAQENAASEAIKEHYATRSEGAQEFENAKDFLSGIVSGERLDVRIDAGHDKESIAVLQMGEKLLIMAEKQDEFDRTWYFVLFSEDGCFDVGYVDSRYVTVEGAVEWETGGITIPERLNVRENPGMSENILTVVPMGTQVTILEKVHDEQNLEWYHVEFLEAGEVVKGYVRADYIGSVGEYFKLYEEYEKLKAIRESNPEAVIEQEIFATEVPFLAEQPEYAEISFIDHVKLELKEGEGWLVDFNGDGTKEQLYINEDGIYVNGMWQKNAIKCSTSEKIQYANGEWTPLTKEVIAEYWLLDIDTTDNMYELLTGNGTMHIFDGEQLQKVEGIQENFRDIGGDVFQRYLGTLGEFTRIDEHTIAFEDRFFLTAIFHANAQYVLDENHNLQIVPQAYDIVDPDLNNHVNWVDYNDTWVKKFKLYTLPDLASAYTEVSELTNIRLLKSDCMAWVYIEDENGLAGWLYFDEETDYYFARQSADYIKVPLRLYKDTNINGEYVEVQFIPTMLESCSRYMQDGSWCYVKLRSGEEGWFQCGYTMWLDDWYANMVREMKNQ